MSIKTDSKKIIDIVYDQIKDISDNKKELPETVDEEENNSTTIRYLLQNLKFEIILFFWVSIIQEKETRHVKKKLDK